MSLPMPSTAEPIPAPIRAIGPYPFIHQLIREKRDRSESQKEAYQGPQQEAKEKALIFAPTPIRTEKRR